MGRRPCSFLAARRIVRMPSIVKRWSFGRSPPWKNRGASRRSPWRWRLPASSRKDMSINASVPQRSSCRMRASQHQSSEAGRPPTEQDRAATRISVLSWRVRLTDVGAVEGRRSMPGIVSMIGDSARLRRSLPIMTSAPTQPCWSSCSRMPFVSPQAPVDTQ